MRRSILCSATALAIGAAGFAYAGPMNLVTNGNFSTTSPTTSAPTQFGPSSGGGSGGCAAWGGQLVSGWTGGSGYQLWYPGTWTSATPNETTQYGCANTQRLPDGAHAAPSSTAFQVTAPPSGGPAYVGVDGQSGLQGEIWQTFGTQSGGNGHSLIAGHKYTVSFDFATTQELSREGATWDYVQVDLAGSAQGPGNGTTSTSQTTGTNFIQQWGFSGWKNETMTFTANAADDVLSFLSIGGEYLCDGHVLHGPLSSCTGTLTQDSFAGSSGVPPFAVLANVNVTAVPVPEPPILGLFGLGVVGLGVAAEVARRRARSRTGAGNDGGIA